MDHHRGPRANRSKKTLPAAFSAGPRHASPHAGAGGTVVGGEKPELSPRLAPPGAPVSRRPSDGGLEIPPPPDADEGCDAGFAVDDQEAIRLDSLVFLSSCAQRHGHFAIKKMLHPPTLQLACLMEIPGAEHQRAILRSSLQAWLSRWCDLQAEYPGLLVAVQEAFWDTPQGYPMAILCEYMPLGSLDDLIQACGGLPEEAMREIAQVVLEALSVMHSVQPPMVHGCLKPSQVLFNTSGRPRLTFGLEQRMKACQVVAAAGGSEGGQVPGVGQSEQSTAVDIFDLGLLLLVSALGGMDVLLDAIPYARKFGSQPNAAALGAHSNDTCSLLLNELRGAAASEVPAAAAADMGYLPPASDLLFNRRYSGPFLAFVSTCLEAHTQSSPVSARDLLRHEFLQSQGEGPLVSLQEMQSLARVLNEAPEHDPSRFGPGTRRSLVPGVAPSVAQSAQLYLMNIAQSISPHCSWSAGSVVPKASVDRRPRWQREEWETLLTDTARTLGLSKSIVQSSLEGQLERILHTSAR